MALFKCEVLFFTLRNSRKHLFFPIRKCSLAKRIVKSKDGEMYFLANIFDISGFFIKLL